MPTETVIFSRRHHRGVCVFGAVVAYVDRIAGRRPARNPTE